MKFLSLVIGFGCLALLEAVALPLNEEDNIALVCRTEGRFEAKDDCGAFIECTLTREGRMLANKRSCHGKAFDVETRTCRNPSKVKRNGCSIREGRHFYSSMRFNRLCADGTVKYACGDCGTQITCSDGKAYETKCEGQLRCTIESTYFGGAVCHTNFDDSCRCTKANSYRQDAYHNGTFFMCKDVDSIPSFYNCPPGMHFNETTKNCLNQDGSPACTEAGVFPYPDDCSKYYMCTYTVERWLQTKLECDDGLLFNEQTKVCENPCEWAEKDFVCEHQGRFRNPKDCSQFYECITSGDSFLRMTRICPPRHMWSDENVGCVPMSQSECAVKPEGPIKQCLKDYNAICKPGDNGDQGSEKPGSSPTAPVIVVEEGEEGESEIPQVVEIPSTPVDTDDSENEISDGTPDGTDGGDDLVPEIPDSPETPTSPVESPEGETQPEETSDGSLVPPEVVEAEDEGSETSNPESSQTGETVDGTSESEPVVPEEAQPETPVDGASPPQDGSEGENVETEDVGSEASAGDALAAETPEDALSGLFSVPLKRQASRNRSYK